MSLFILISTRLLVRRKLARRNFDRQDQRHGWSVSFMIYLFQRQAIIRGFNNNRRLRYVR